MNLNFTLDDREHAIARIAGAEYGFARIETSDIWFSVEDFKTWHAVNCSYSAYNNLAIRYDKFVTSARESFTLDSPEHFFNQARKKRLQLLHSHIRYRARRRAANIG